MPRRDACISQHTPRDECIGAAQDEQMTSHRQLRTADAELRASKLEITSRLQCRAARLTARNERMVSL